jgi:hypothetical protein
MGTIPDRIGPAYRPYENIEYAIFLARRNHFVVADATPISDGSDFGSAPCRGEGL